MIQHPVIDLPKQRVTGIEPVEVAIEDQFYPMALALLRQCHLLNLIQSKGVAVKPTNDKQHILGHLADVLTKSSRVVAIRQWATTTFKVSHARHHWLPETCQRGVLTPAAGRTRRNRSGTHRH